MTRLTGFVKGQKKVLKRLKNFRDSDATTIMNSALLAGARVVRDKARKSVPSKWRKKKNSIKARAKKARKGKLKDIKIGWAVSNRKPAPEKNRKEGGVGISAANIHWFVLGTKVRRTKAGENRGRIHQHWGLPLRPILRTAARGSRRAVVRAMVASAKPRIKKYRAKGRVRKR